MKPLTDEEKVLLATLKQRDDAWREHIRMPLLAKVNSFINLYHLHHLSGPLADWMVANCHDITNLLRPYIRLRRKLFIVSIAGGVPELFTREEMYLRFGTLIQQAAGELNPGEGGKYEPHFFVSCVQEPA